MKVNFELFLEKYDKFQRLSLILMYSSRFDKGSYELFLEDEG